MGFPQTSTFFLDRKRGNLCDALGKVAENGAVVLVNAGIVGESRDACVLPISP
ncbi:MAG: hypothetical protein ACLFP4_15280 [Spirochaetales bacterium]